MCTRVYITAIYPSEIVAPMKQGATTETTPVRLIARPGTGLSSDDEHLFRDLLERFAVLAETCFRFSRGIYLRVSGSPEPNTEDAVRRNLSSRLPTKAHASAEAARIVQTCGPNHSIPRAMPLISRP